MGKKLIISMLLTAFGLTTLAAHSAPSVQYSKDANYIYVKQPLRVTFDAEQQAALKSGISFITGQLQQLSALRAAADPNGDLKSINDSIVALNAKLDLLMQVSAQVYGEVAPLGLKQFQVLPSAVIVFAGANADKNIFRFVQIGGSASIGVVMVPMLVQRISIKNPSEVTSHVDWTENSALIVMALGVGGVQASPTTLVTGQTAPTASGGGRAGIGFIWGELNKASDLVGLAGGGTITVNMGAGVNAKFLGLKNWSKPSAVNNYILMVGVQKSADLNSKIPFLNIDAEFGANLGLFVDAGTTFSGASQFVIGVGQTLSGTKKDADK